MKLTRKGSRLIVVEGISYRWLIRRKESWDDIHIEIQNMPNGVPLRVLIEQENVNGTLLVVTSDQPRLTKYKMVKESGIIRPADVARWIKEALAVGWQPSKPGPAFHRNGEIRPA